MKVSIITTIYQAEKDLPRLLDSMMAQKSAELEFFLIDNGSPDRCGEICQEYAKKDPRFKIYALKDNIGYIRARNLGIKLVDGDYIGFCDSDDFLEPNGYDRAVEKIKKVDCDFYLTSYRTITNEKSELHLMPFKTGLYSESRIQDMISPQVFGFLPGRGFLHGFAWKQIIRRSIIMENGFSFMEVLKPYEDQLFNADIIGKCDKVYVDDTVIYDYVINQESITAQLYANFDPEAERDRILLLYSEKDKRTRNKLEQTANCNQCFHAIYSSILTMTKCQEMIGLTAKKIRELYKHQKIRQIIVG